MRRKLSFQYCLLHGLYWSAYCCVFGFAVASLLSKGFQASAIGVGLAAATLLSGFFQPLAASMADRYSDRGLKRLLLIVALLCTLCFLVLRLFPPPKAGYLLFYVSGALLLDMLQPLLNALCGYYSDHALPLHYGPARGVGSIFYAVVSLYLGTLLEHRGGTITPSLPVLYLCGFLLLSARLPSFEGISASSAPKTPERHSPSSLYQFVRSHPLFCSSLLGILSMQACHIMIETYLISILECVGGGSGDLGVTLAIATCVEIPVLLLYPRFHYIAPVSVWMKISGLSTFLKALAFFLAPNVLCVMLAQFLQVTSYAIYAACAVDYARETIPPKDAVKGQAMVTSACAFGSSLGNFLGGQLLSHFGAEMLLLNAVVLGSISAVVFLLTIKPPA